MIIVQNLIYEIRGQRVMLDSDLAKLYQVTTGALNQAVKRNMERFPADFMFRLTDDEVLNMMSQSVISSKRKASSPPFAFTEQGVAMLASVLKLLTTASMSSELRELRTKVDLLAMQQEENLAAVNDLSEDVRKEIDNLYLAIAELSTRLEEKKNEPRPKIGFQQNIDK